MKPPTSKPLLALHQLSLYNTGRMSPEQIIAAFAARRQQFDRIVADLVAEKPPSRAQHHLIVGQRGMGKTMLLARIAAELRMHAELAKRFIPLVFAEEQYAVDRLSKFWLNCLDSLADARELAGEAQAVRKIDDAVNRLQAGGVRPAKDDQAFADEVYQAFAKAAEATGQRPVLLVDNLQLVFERLETTQQHSLRELLMRPGSPILVGSSPSPPPQSQDYGAVFYDHFKVHYLRPLDESEMRALLMHLAETAQRDDVRQRVLEHPGRLTVLRQLTGGNPRTVLTLFFLYAEDFAPSVFGDLEGLLDRVTPLYKARFEELTAQQQVVASAIANHWDPVTAAELVAATSLPAGTVSAQLDRLEKTGVVERTELFGETRIGYQLAERFFNIWFLMRSASRRQRREVEFLTRFLESFYEPPDRARLARHLMSESGFSPDRYLLSCAVAASLPDSETADDLNRHTELAALREKAHEARARMHELIDFSTLPKATLEFAELERKLRCLVPADAKIEPEKFAQAVLGDRTMLINRERDKLAARPAQLTWQEIQSVIETIKKSRIADIRNYSKAAVAWFSGRLATGQIRSLCDAEDWNRAFHHTGAKKYVQLMVHTLPGGFAASLSEATWHHIRNVLEPKPNAPAWDWAKWAYNLHVHLGAYAEAATAYRKVIADDATGELRLALVWNNLGHVLQTHLECYAEAETAFREAITRDPLYSTPWYNLGVLLHLHLQRYGDAEAAYREALARDPKSWQTWSNLANLLQHDPERSLEAEAALRNTIDLNPNAALAWAGLGDLLRKDPQRFAEAEVAYRESISIDPNDARCWNGLGNLYCDDLNRLFEAGRMFEMALRLDPKNESVHQNHMFLRRDFLGEGPAARPLITALKQLPEHTFRDTTYLHEALFAAYDSNWGFATEALSKALGIRTEGFSPNTIEDWLRASAVLLHLNYGAELLVFLEQRGDTARLRPWVEALRALHGGDREALQNVAPEVRTTAQVFYDGIERRSKALPEHTRRRPHAQAQPKRRGRK